MTKIKATNITWHDGHVGREEPAGRPRPKGARVWATGLSGAGESAVGSRGEPNGQQGNVGFFMGEVRKNGQTFVRVLGGNQNDSVNETLYPKDRLLAYRRPPKLTPGG